MTELYHSKRKNSGQVLIIAALIVTMLLLSTAIYVAETQKTQLKYNPGEDEAFSNYKQGITHTAVSALANISNGGNTDVLATNLNQFKDLAANQSYNAILKLDFTPSNDAPYRDGVWISWASNGKGVASASVNLSLDSAETSATYHSEYLVNISSEIEVNGHYTLLNESAKQVNLSCTIRNEGKLALARNFTVYYEKDGSLQNETWVQVTTPIVNDFGIGTYSMSFTVETEQQDDPVIILITCSDLRNIMIKTSLTCNQV